LMHRNERLLTNSAADAPTHGMSCALRRWAPLAASRAATVGRSRPSVPTNDQQELVEGLSLLADALDDPLVDLKSVLDVLTADLVTSVPGYLGLTVAVQMGGHPVLINTIDIEDADDARATLMLPLSPVNGGTTGSVVLYSRTTDAFLSMAGEVRWIFNLDGPAPLDAHLPFTVAPAPPVGVRGLTTMCAINQAVGILVVDGYTVLPPARSSAAARTATASPCRTPRNTSSTGSVHRWVTREREPPPTSSFMSGPRPARSPLVNGNPW
jgi:hypothetical protein